MKPVSNILSLVVYIALGLGACTSSVKQEPVQVTPAQTSHLKDSIRVSGDVLVFLRPDSNRYAVLEADPEDGVAEVDSDFGFAIAETQSQQQKDERFSGIGITVTDKRYIILEGCGACPMVIDRDTVDYGHLLSGNGRRPQMVFQRIHGGDYTPELETYFSMDSLYAFRKGTVLASFRTASLFGLKDTIYADLDGDGLEDKAYFEGDAYRPLMVETAGRKLNVGLGQSFKNIGDDFSWASYWALTTDSVTMENQVVNDEPRGMRKQRLAKRSLVIQRDESGGGVVSFIKGQWVWVHQAD